MLILRFSKPCPIQVTLCLLNRKTNSIKKFNNISYVSYILYNPKKFSDQNDQGVHSTKKTLMRTCLSELELISQSLQGLVTIKTSSHKLTIIDSSFENDVAENNDIKQVRYGPHTDPKKVNFTTIIVVYCIMCVYFQTEALVESHICAVSGRLLNTTVLSSTSSRT